MKDGDGTATVSWSEPVDPELAIILNVPEPALPGTSFEPLVSTRSPGEVRFSLGSDSTAGACALRGTEVLLRRSGRCQVVATQDPAPGYTDGFATKTFRVVPADTEAFDVRLDSRRLVAGRRQTLVLTGAFFENLVVTDNGRRVSPPDATGDQAGRYRLTWTPSRPGTHRVRIVGDPDYRVASTSFRLVRR